MKKFILLAAAVAAMALTGCKPTESMFIQEAFVLNYEEIAGPDFLITESDAVGFDYVGVASLDVFEFTGATKAEKKNRNEKDEVYGDRVVTYYDTSGKRVANMRSALGYAVQEAKKLGGDGIIRLRTKAVWDEEIRRVGWVEVTGNTPDTPLGKISRSKCGGLVEKT